MTMEEDKRNEDYTSTEEELSGDEPDEDMDDEFDNKEESREEKEELTFKAVDSDRFRLFQKEDEEEDKQIPIEERLKSFTESTKGTESKGGNKVLTFKLKKHSEKQTKRDEERKAHVKERAQLRRPAKYRHK